MKFFCRLSFALSLSALFVSSVVADTDEEKAKAEIAKLEGRVQKIAANDDRQEVYFHLSGKPINDQALGLAAKVSKLAWLNVRGKDITDAGVAMIKDKKELERLHLEKTKITDAGLAHLAGLENLTYLNLYGTAVTDAGLDHLASLKKLKKLYVWQTKVTDAGAMKLQKKVPGLQVILAAKVAKAVPAKTDDFKSIFDGKTLTGWEGNKEFWSVKDGVITGTTTAEKKLSKNTFLVWKAGKVDDFELHLKFRIVGGNSGIQYRSEDLGDYVLKGYQADIDATNKFIGIIYGERTGRGIINPRCKKVVVDAANGKAKVTGDSSDEKKFLASLKKEDWNDYVIIAKGNHLVQKINGFVTADLTDNHKQKVLSGVLGLQLHTGPPMVVQFKDIKLKVLPKK